MQKKVFSKLIAPQTAFCANAGSKTDKESCSKVLFFENFLQILVFSTSIGVESMRKLIKELATNSAANNLSLAHPLRYLLF